MNLRSDTPSVYYALPGTMEKILSMHQVFPGTKGVIGLLCYQQIWSFSDHIEKKDFKF